MEIKNIVFDVGKVLVYFEPDWIMNKLAYDEETKMVLRKAMFESPLWNEVEWTRSLKERGYHLYIISNYGEYTLQQTGHKMDFMQYMDGAIFSYRYQILKPDARIYEQLIENYGLKVEECVFIDDKVENVEGAKQAGYYGIVFTSYEEVSKELEELLRGNGDA